MNTNNKLNKANSYRLSQELLRNKALKQGVNLIAPETVFLSNDTQFGKNVTIEPYVVIGPKVKIGKQDKIFHILPMQLSLFPLFDIYIRHFC